MKRSAFAMLAVAVLPFAAAAADPADAVKVIKQVWRKGGHTNVGIADITLGNDNPFAVKDIKIRCVFTTRSTGKVTEIQQTIAGPIKPNSEQTFKKVSFGFVDTQAADGACEVRGATQI
ncbi:hypothetical protein JQ557_11555 [Bradyrhizobium sp. U87765 SZCCT0131]|uniref:hypothetical protein n=1 Tax=unclassified Bradyrhizobium TaxID=2631580 RepID=UPI001BAD41DA|nr:MULTISPECIES: hypothetical protein [unclassified Bradyrhizobium]MBR1218629.1 hypothetical protein [Bradyrhizobium sp. U87765 SZCCT0131]MBR1265612.1 hypothetical protein [Bradyrhizobium sp. U87765 SZCCT0134]MBR1304127.1 hypothetical protein [Bradyrhizobium sp. U87765 SZCCT0110]MBR1319733.1 hypothetical protein [Bradyrhizobium sp. U87765 SZCCT0109]MBR1348058.1 hypothetical protein [Bradyrhizobium sp. U87765 SZCCT0048]